MLSEVQVRAQGGPILAGHILPTLSAVSLKSPRRGNAYAAQHSARNRSAEEETFA